MNVMTNGPLNLSGIISGSGTLIKTGTGTLTFSGNKVNTYSGQTTVNQGTLLLSRSTSNAIPAALTIRRRNRGRECRPGEVHCKLADCNLVP
jgi:autotransporter-associated beta strand protein